MADYDVMPGAEPFSAAGGPHGALVLHGFTATPQSVRGVAEALAAAGFAVELPLLPGHGTSVEDLVTTGWAEWSAAAEAAYQALAARCSRVVVAGLSMGGTLTAWLATRHSEIAGIVVINGLIDPIASEARKMLDMMIDQQVLEIPGIGSDIALVGSTELSYPTTPVPTAKALMDTLDGLAGEWAKITSPVLIFNSPDDHVVPPASSDTLAAAVQGPVERITLERSYHVATLDFDKDLIEQETVAFARRVTDG